MKEYILLIVGRSGSGKSTVADILEQQYEMKSIQSYTTRPKRTPSEKGHIFVTDEEFDALNDFVGYTEFNGYRYGATEEQVKDSDIYVIDPSGIEYFFEKYKGNKIPVVVYLDASPWLCFKRVFKRDGIKSAISRCINDNREFKNILSICPKAQYFLSIKVTSHASPQRIVNKIILYLLTYKQRRN